MRISNIQNYLGGADNIIARERSEANQFLLSIEDGTIDFSSSATTFDIKADLFEANVTRKRGSIVIDSLTAVNSATQHTYTKAELIYNTSTAGKFELLVPSTLLISSICVTVNGSYSSLANSRLSSAPNKLLALVPLLVPDPSTVDQDQSKVFAPVP